MEEKKSNKNVSNGSSKRKRFTDLAPIRVNNVLKHLRLVGNMTNKNNYAYDSAEFKKIIKDIEDEFKMVKSQFEGQERKRAKKWKL